MANLDRITIRLDEDKKRRLAMLKARDNQSFKQIITNLIDRYLDEQSTYSFGVKASVKRSRKGSERNSKSNLSIKGDDSKSAKRKPKRHGSGII